MEHYWDEGYGYLYGYNDEHVGGTVYTGRHSYIQSIKWEDFIKSPSLYLDITTEIRDDLDRYNISKLVTVEE